MERDGEKGGKVLQRQKRQWTSSSFGESNSGEPLPVPVSISTNMYDASPVVISLASSVPPAQIPVHTTEVLVSNLSG